jgi:hypothetical protein
MGYLDEYGGDAYRRMVDMGQAASQHGGEIKGILMHQGEADWEDDIRDLWAGKVKAVYESLISDLGLNASEVPLLVGEMLREDQGGALGWFNDYVGRVPQLVSTAHVISSEGCPMMPGDTYDLHFSREGYQLLGERYANKMLEILGY